MSNESSIAEITIKDKQTFKITNRTESTVSIKFDSSTLVFCVAISVMGLVGFVDCVLTTGH